MNDMWVAYSWMAVSLAGLAGFWLHLHYRSRDRLRNPGQEQLESAIRDLEADLGAVTESLQEQLDQMQERLDFAERLLASRSSASPQASEQSEIPTPV